MGSPNNCVNKPPVQQRSICVAISLTLCGKRETKFSGLSPDLRHVLFHLFLVEVVDLLRPSLENACFNALYAAKCWGRPRYVEIMSLISGGLRILRARHRCHSSRVSMVVPYAPLKEKVIICKSGSKSCCHVWIEVFLTFLGTQKETGESYIPHENGHVSPLLSPNFRTHTHIYIYIYSYESKNLVPKR